MRLVLACVLGLAAAPLAAETPIGAERFDALTEGRSMTWSEFGQVYGVEQYLPGRRVRWTLLGDTCVEGVWYAEGTAICFAYEDRPDPICWEMTETATGLNAALVSTVGDSAFVVIEDATEPMACFGPEVGV
ncbi:MAG: hypothetical protein B7Z10_00155 [Rhodobacterales bacterium 32-66-7]|nr:MAG: hypothetical protein B7Z31_03780 [Rhodobacterales bacterium 12-65-15]OYX27523.1 MAG: hypothetical protein B7Z10_00155 [Rhodobacterales bacterium 32-66-7]OZA07425.1 MAG: hypothetical protein B7Y02_13960 [Rhodobacterales bacterium 17-64-5]